MITKNSLGTKPQRVFLPFTFYFSPFYLFLFTFTKIFHPSIRTAMSEIVFVVHVGVCLTLKRDVVIGIAFHKHTHQPLREIPYVESHKEHLAHLCRVYALVANHMLRYPYTVAAKQHTKQVDGIEAAWRKKTVADYYHGENGER